MLDCNLCAHFYYRKKGCIGNVVLQALEGSLHPPLNIIASQDLDDPALGGDEAKLFWTEMSCRVNLDFLADLKI